MRLWHQELIPYLPSAQLNGQHRECCALRGLGWGKPHSTVNYVFMHNPSLLVKFHMLIMKEKRKRGHAWTDPVWLEPLYRGSKCEPWTLERFDMDLYKREDDTNIYPEHNSTYLEECLENLRSKGAKLIVPFK
jgi:uncharacterized protein (TIGR02328 family)